MTLHWPRKITLTERIPVGGGAKSFAWWRSASFMANRLFRRQRVELGGSNLLVLVCQGNLLLEHGNRFLRVRKGGAGLVLQNRRFSITEIPDTAGRFSALYVSFQDSEIAGAIGKGAGVHAKAVVVAPARHDVYVLDPSMETRRLCVNAFENPDAPVTVGLRLGLRQIFASFDPFAWMFLKDGYCARKAALDLWMETNVLSGVTLEELEQAYPTGAYNFRRDFRTYQKLNPRQWVRRRKMELAASWLRHGGDSMEAIRSALGYKSADAFRWDYRHENKKVPEKEDRLSNHGTLKLDEATEAMQPFWLKDLLAALKDFLAPVDKVRQEPPPGFFQPRDAEIAEAIAELERRFQESDEAARIRDLPAPPPQQAVPLNGDESASEGALDASKLEIQEFWAMKRTYSQKIINVIFRPSKNEMTHLADLRSIAA